MSTGSATCAFIPASSALTAAVKSPSGNPARCSDWPHPGYSLHQMRPALLKGLFLQTFCKIAAHRQKQQQTYCPYHRKRDALLLGLISLTFPTRYTFGRNRPAPPPDRSRRPPDSYRPSRPDAGDHDRFHAVGAMILSHRHMLQKANSIQVHSTCFFKKSTNLACPELAVAFYKINSRLFQNLVVYYTLIPEHTIRGTHMFWGKRAYILPLNSNPRRNFSTNF